MAFARFWYRWSLCFGGLAVGLFMLNAAMGNTGSAVFSAVCLAIHVPLAWYWRGEMRKRLATDVPKAPND